MSHLSRLHPESAAAQLLGRVKRQHIRCCSHFPSQARVANYFKSSQLWIRWSKCPHYLRKLRLTSPNAQRPTSHVTEQPSTGFLPVHILGIFRILSSWDLENLQSIPPGRRERLGDERSVLYTELT